MTESKHYPDSPTQCKVCGKFTDGVATIYGKGICRDCWDKFDLSEKLGFSPWELMI